MPSVIIQQCVPVSGEQGRERQLLRADRIGAAGRRRTPGASSSKNWMPAFSRVDCTCDSVEVREPISPAKDSMRRIVPMATRDRLASSSCSQPMSARAARNCLPVIKFRR